MPSGPFAARDAGAMPGFGWSPRVLLANNREIMVTTTEIDLLFIRGRLQISLMNADDDVI
jgi:hypothetical protein